jgi:hypothetical protein
MEQANPGMERARITSRLNSVRAEIKEVEAQLEVAKKNAAFEAKHSDDPYWRIAKQKYIETGDPSYVENFRAKQDALENAQKDRAERAEMNRQNKAKQDLYDEAEARKAIRLAQNALDAAEATQNQRQITDAKTELEYAKEHYKNVTGYEYKESNSTPTKYEEAKSWLNTISGIDEIVPDVSDMSATEVGAEIMKYTDKGGKRFKTERQKREMIDWLKSHEDERKKLGVDLDQLEARYSQEVADSKANAKKQNINSLKTSYNEALRKGDEAEKERIWNQLEKLEVKMPRDIYTPFDI